MHSIKKKDRRAMCFIINKIVYFIHKCLFTKRVNDKRWPMEHLSKSSLHYVCCGFCSRARPSFPTIRRLEKMRTLDSMKTALVIACRMQMKGKSHPPFLNISKGRSRPWSHKSIKVKSCIIPSVMPYQAFQSSSNDMNNHPIKSNLAVW